MSSRRPIITDLTMLNNKTVEGRGFRVTVPDIHHAVYCDGGQVAEVEIEGGGETGHVDWLIYTATLRPLREKDMQFVRENREEIIGRISRALSLLGMPHSLA